MSPVQGKSPPVLMTILCRLKNPTVISIWLLVGFHPATRSVQSTPADNTRKQPRVYKVHLPIILEKGLAVYRERKRKKQPGAIIQQSVIGKLAIVLSTFSSLTGPGIPKVADFTFFLKCLSVSYMMKVTNSTFGFTFKENLVGGEWFLNTKCQK